MNKYKDKDLRGSIESLPQNIVDNCMEQQSKQNELEYKEFIENLRADKCYMCGDDLNSFNLSKPCFHWFTHPSGIKKKHFKNYLETPIGFFRLDSYFRWLANSENPLFNINSLKEETSKASYLESTYKYKNIEWAFSVGHTDKEGHVKGKVGASPHFHIQMKVDDRVFLNFNYFHIPFSDEDLFKFELLDQAGDKVKHVYPYGSGIEILDDETNLDQLDSVLKVTSDSKEAQFRRQTIIKAPEGKPISGELLQEAMQESERTGEPIGRIMQRLLSDADVTTVISPSKDIPKMSKRSGKK